MPLAAGLVLGLVTGQSGALDRTGSRLVPADPRHPRLARTGAQRRLRRLAPSEAPQHTRGSACGRGGRDRIGHHQRGPGQRAPGGFRCRGAAGFRSGPAASATA